MCSLNVRCRAQQGTYSERAAARIIRDVVRTVAQVRALLRCCCSAAAVDVDVMCSPCSVDNRCAFGAAALLVPLLVLGSAAVCGCCGGACCGCSSIGGWAVQARLSMVACLCVCTALIHSHHVSSYLFYVRSATPKTS